MSNPHRIRVTTVEGNPIINIERSPFSLRAGYVDMLLAYLHKYQADGKKHEWEEVEDEHHELPNPSFSFEQAIDADSLPPTATGPDALVARLPGESPPSW